MLSLVIPCYNEEENLEKLFSKLKSLVNTYSKEDIEIVIVDNGSTDNSNKIIKNSNLFLDKKIKLVEIEKNIGYGNGVYEGLKYSTKKITFLDLENLRVNKNNLVYSKLKKKIFTEMVDAYNNMFSLNLDLKFINEKKFLYFLKKELK